MKEIAVSIIIPSLNSASYIRECMESVINQTLTNIEIICVDADSKDGTLEILKIYKTMDRRVRVINSKKKSYGYQVNLGIKAARGKFIGIVESDDFIETKFYEKLVTMAEGRNVDFVKMGYREFCDVGGGRVFNNRITAEVAKIANQCIDLYLDRKKGMIELNHIWSGIYRREFLIDNQLWFNETPGASYQDTSFSILVGLVADCCVYMRECMYNYRLDNPGSSVKLSSKWRCVIDEYEYIDYYLKESGKETYDILVTERKINTYVWNYSRLDENAKRLFFEEIQKELQEILHNKEYLKRLSKSSLEKLNMLTSKERLKLYEKEEKQARAVYRVIMKAALSKIKFFVVGAGTYFLELCFLQQVWSTVYIEAVCDNSVVVQGKSVEGYQVESVEDLVRKAKDEYWIVANKHCGDEIKLQLCSLGVTEDRIIIFDRVLSHDKMLGVWNKVKADFE